MANAELSDAIQLTIPKITLGVALEIRGGHAEENQRPVRSLEVIQKRVDRMPPGLD